MHEDNDAVDSWLQAALAPFRTGVFRSIWLASLASNVGTLVQTVGAAWLMASLVHSAHMVALVQAMSALPIMLLSIPAGAIADIWDRRALMLIAQALMAVTAAVFAVLAYGHALGPWMLLTFTFLLGCGSALYGPAWQASVGEQVPASHLAAAVSLNAISFNIARTVGPALGGVIVATAGPPAAFLLNALSYAALIVVLLRWRRPRVPATLPPESIGAALATGLRYVRLSPGIRNVLVRSFGFSILASAIWATVPLVARDVLHGGPLTFGLLLGAFGLGAVASALGSAWLRRRHAADTLVSACSVAYGLATVAVAHSSYVGLSAVALLFAGAAWVLAFSTFNITTQTSAPRWVVGRTLAIYQMAAFGGVAVGSWMWGIYAEYASLEASLTTAGVLLAGSIALARRWPLHPAPPIDLVPLRTAVDEHAGIGVDPEAGPIVISIEYRIAAEDTAAFVEAAHALGRVRRRDGARRWILLQNLDDPSVWHERFETVTWLDHLRQSQRVTVADRELRERVAALHRGSEPPRTRHLLARSLEDAHAAPEEPAGRPGRTDPQLSGGDAPLVVRTRRRVVADGPAAGGDGGPPEALN